MNDPALLILALAPGLIDGVGLDLQGLCWCVR